MLGTNGIEVDAGQQQFRTGRTMMDKYDNIYQSRKLGLLDDYVRAHYKPYNNSDWKFNDNEPRQLPPSLVIDPSYYWIH